MNGLLAVVAVVIGLAFVVSIAMYAVGREVVLLEQRVQPAVYEVEEAVRFIAERLPESIAARISHDDVRWVLQADAYRLERATDEGVDNEETEVVDDVDSIGRVLSFMHEEEEDLSDEAIAVILNLRLEYLRDIGAVGNPA